MNITTFKEPLAVNVEQATQLLGFKSKRSVYKLIYAGELKARKSGRIILISYKSLKSYIEGED